MRSFLVVEEQEEEAEIKILACEEETEISFQALQGKIVVRTIRLEGFIKNQSVGVLVDTESTHNFM